MTTPSLPGPGANPFFPRRFARQCRRLACRWALLAGGPARLGTGAVCGAGAGAALCVLASAAAVPPGAFPGDAPAPQQRSSSSSRGSLEFGHKQRRVTDTILVINCLCMMLQWLSKGMLTFWGTKINSYILEGQLWRFITPTFLHSGLAHLLINSYALNSLGPQVEVLSGGPRFLTIYLASAVTGTLASFLMTPQPSLGSSGSIFGIAAALAIFYWRHQQALGPTSDKMLQQLGLTAAINLGCSLFIRNIDNWGHVGGMVGGAAVAWLLGPHMQRNQLGRYVDQPPLRWLAHPEGHVFVERGPDRDRAALDGPQASQSQSQGDGSHGVSSTSSAGPRISRGGKSSVGGSEAHRGISPGGIGGSSASSSSRKGGRSRQGEEQDQKARGGKTRAEGAAPGPD